MEATFYISSVVAIASAIMAITRRNAVHGLLNLVVLMLALAVIFYVLGAPFVAALEVIIYAGAIMVLFVFVIMMVNVGQASKQQERQWTTPLSWVVPIVLGAVLLIEMVAVLAAPAAHIAPHMVGPGEVGAALYGPYLLGVEIASMLLLAGLVGAYHLGLRMRAQQQTKGTP